MCFKTSFLATICEGSVTFSALWRQPHLDRMPLAMGHCHHEVNRANCGSWFVTSRPAPSLSCILRSSCLPKTSILLRSPQPSFGLAGARLSMALPSDMRREPGQLTWRLCRCPQWAPETVQGLCYEVSLRNLHFKTLQEDAVTTTGKRIIVCPQTMTNKYRHFQLGSVGETLIHYLCQLLSCFWGG